MFRLFFPKKTVDDVLAGFRKTVADLRAIAEAKDARANTLTVEAEILRLQARDASFESTRAVTIADRLEKLVS